jgi:hypothetical protein
MFITWTHHLSFWILIPFHFCGSHDNEYNTLNTIKSDENNPQNVPCGHPWLYDSIVSAVYLLSKDQNN